MTDETKPKRVRGLKEREAAYRAGYQDGMRDAVQEIEARQAMDAIREARIGEGLKRLRTDATSAPKRTRRTKKRDLDSIPAAGPEHRAEVG